jgi:hypothetical protein
LISFLFFINSLIKINEVIKIKNNPVKKISNNKKSLLMLKCSLKNTRKSINKNIKVNKIFNNLNNVKQKI